MELTGADVLAEFDSWLAEQRDTPAKRWVLANKPDVFHVANTFVALWEASDMHFCPHPVSIPA